jgi:hypothetical protein
MEAQEAESSGSPDDLLRCLKGKIGNTFAGDVRVDSFSAWFFAG